MGMSGSCGRTKSEPITPREPMMILEREGDMLSVISLLALISLLSIQILTLWVMPPYPTSFFPSIPMNLRSMPVI